MTTHDLIGTDGLTILQRRTLALVLNMIVPPSPDGRMPGAADVDVLGYLRRSQPDSIGPLQRELDRLETRAQRDFSAAFAELDPRARRRLVDMLRIEDPRFLHDLALHTVTCYYQDDRVLVGLGMEPRTPYPLGYEVKSGDLSLLEPVRQRGRMWRDAGDGTAGPAV